MNAQVSGQDTGVITPPPAPCPAGTLQPSLPRPVDTGPTTASTSSPTSVALHVAFPFPSESPSCHRRWSGAASMQSWQLLLAVRLESVVCAPPFRSQPVARDRPGPGSPAKTASVPSSKGRPRRPLRALSPTRWPRLDLPRFHEPALCSHPPLKGEASRFPPSHSGSLLIPTTDQRSVFSMLHAQEKTHGWEGLSARTACLRPRIIPPEVTV